MCDAFHDGSGFLTHHLALTIGVEAAIRAVNPAVTMPYWDFTIEGEAIVQAGGLPSMFMDVTPVLSAEWFGSVDDNNHIADSRWAHTIMPTQRDKLSSVKNSYGIIRSYWNNNPDPEVPSLRPHAPLFMPMPSQPPRMCPVLTTANTLSLFCLFCQVNRFLFKTCGVEPTYKKIPACEEHWAVLNAYNLGSFQQIAPGDGHGPMHVQVGLGNSPSHPSQKTPPTQHVCPLLVLV